MEEWRNCISVHFANNRKDSQPQVWPLRERSLWACGLELRFHLPPARTIRSDRKQAFWGVPARPSKPVLGKTGKPVGCGWESFLISEDRADWSVLTSISLWWRLRPGHWAPYAKPHHVILDPGKVNTDGLLRPSVPLVYGDALTGLYGASQCLQTTMEQTHAFKWMVFCKLSKCWLLLLAV